MFGEALDFSPARLLIELRLETIVKCADPDSKRIDDYDRRHS
jgi:hypothetical protein